MFKVGKRYTLTFIEEGCRSIEPNWIAVDVQLPLVRFRRDKEERIINTSSSAFFHATED